SDSYSVGLLLSFIDNYLILKDQQYKFVVLTSNQQSFKNLQINIKENTQIFKCMQLLVVWDRQKRVSISEIKQYGQNEEDILGLIDHLNDKGYQCLDIIGKGGFGVVLRAFSKKLQSDVAIKCLKVKKNNDFEKLKKE
ncbi:hypothetical protein ABPG72_008181, partial [Tetrahymena utriculariae]